MIHTCSLLFVLLFAFSGAQSSAFYQDTTVSQHLWQSASHRSFDEEKISAYKNDSDFQYEVGPRVKGNFLYNLINRFLEWLTGKDFEGLSINGSWILTLIKWSLYSLLIAAVVFVIMQLLKMRGAGLAHKKGAAVLEHDVFAEDIHTIDFEKSIGEAMDNKQYRLVIRLYYLYALKRLSDKGAIIWQPSKTNYDYQGELKNETLKPHFNTLGYYFEFIWYGNFEVKENMLEEVKGSFYAIDKGEV